MLIHQFSLATVVVHIALKRPSSYMLNQHRMFPGGDGSGTCALPWEYSLGWFFLNVIAHEGRRIAHTVNSQMWLIFRMSSVVAVVQEAVLLCKDVYCVIHVEKQTRHRRRRECYPAVFFFFLLFSFFWPYLSPKSPFSREYVCKYQIVKGTFPRTWTQRLVAESGS